MPQSTPLPVANIGAAQADPMPIVPLGIREDMFHFRRADGSECLVPPTALFHQPTLIALFRGEDWLRRNFPGQFIVVTQRAGGGRRVPVGIHVQAAAWYLARRCGDAELARVVVMERGTRRVSAWAPLRARLRDWLRQLHGLIAVRAVPMRRVG